LSQTAKLLVIGVTQVTGNATTHDAAGYAEDGFTATLGKPFALEDLKDVLEYHVIRHMNNLTVHRTA
jgi:hypothetical protein